MKVSQTLPRVEVSEIGRSLSIVGVGDTLGTGTMTAHFHWVGTDPEDSDEFKISVAGMLSSNANCFRSLLGILSGPGAVAVFTRESSRHISLLVTVGGGLLAGRNAGSSFVLSAGREHTMELKCALIALATSEGVSSSMPGRLTVLFLVRLPLSSLAVLYHERGSLLVLAAESFDAANDCLAVVIAFATAFR